MTLTAGARFGPFAIVSTLGSGGMGVVYRARDTRLDRDVAVKILPEAFALDEERLARFQREAKTLASLNHPNIGSLHGLEEANGVTALIMELVEGDDLLERLARGPMPLEEALLIARQIAEALEAAHGQGVIHRDLKPANIKVRPDGRVKVLDFGLAKVMEPAGSPASGSQSPTITSPAMTQAGLILGTAAYMSPEQARGKPLDKRTDIWAFGCVLYEMLTGRRAFKGDDVSDVLASVLAREPDLTAVPATVPPSIRRLLRRCLEKDRDERLHDIADARIEIRDGLSKADPEAAVVTAPAAGRQRLAWIAALTALTLGAGASLMLLLRPRPDAAEMHVELTTPSTMEPQSFAISPDGHSMALVADAEGQSRLWLRSLESGSSRALIGTDGAQLPFWSPDSRSIGFFADGRIKRFDVDGGSIQVLANAARGLGGTWNRDDVILFATLGSPILRVSAAGRGTPVALSGLALQGSDFSPHFLPDGRGFLYFVRGGPEVRGVYAGRLDEARDARRLLQSDTGAVYARSGHLLFIHQGTLYAHAFDPVRLELAGRPFIVAEGVASAGLQQVLSVSDTDAIAYRSGTGIVRHQFVWFDRSGRELGRLGDASAASVSQPSLSPDDQRVAYYGGTEGNPDIFVLDTKRGASTVFTTDAADDVFPIWSPDGSRIAFSSNRTGVHNLYVASVTGEHDETVLLATSQPKSATDWSRDGRFVLFNTQNAKTPTDIMAVPADGKGKPFPVVQTTFEEWNGQFSPDGRWIAYVSNKSGRFEVYIHPFPGPGSETLVSTNGGLQPRWGRGDKELFYVARSGHLTVVPVRIAPDAQPPDVGTPVALFAPPLGGAVQRGDFRHQYMVSADGQRFLVATVKEDSATSPITVILNWKPRP